MSGGRAYLGEGRGEAWDQHDARDDHPGEEDERVADARRGGVLT